MSLEEREKRESLISKYKRDQTQRSESKLEDDDGCANATLSIEVKQELLHSYSSSNLGTQYNPEKASHVVDVQGNKKLEEKELEVEKLTTKLTEYKTIIATQKQELENLTNMLSKISEEKNAAIDKLHLAVQSLQAKELELNNVKDRLNNEDIDRLKYDLTQFHEKYRDASIRLREERDQNAKIKEEISLLKSSLSSSSAAEKDLEVYATQESEKTKKLENQLNFLLEKFNEQRKLLHDNFTTLHGQSEDFFKKYENYHQTLVKSVSEDDI